MKHFMRGYKQHISGKVGAHIICCPIKCVLDFREKTVSQISVDQTFKTQNECVVENIVQTYCTLLES